MQTLIDLVRERAGTLGTATAYTFLPDALGPGEEVSYAQLQQRVERLAAALQERAVAGDRALLIFPPGPDFILAFFACLHAGIVAVPAYPPQKLDQWSRVAAILGDSGSRHILTTPLFLDQVRTWLDATPPLREVACIDTTALVMDDGPGWREPAVGSGDLAFLQYTSGSTSAPKGVMVTHGNLLANLEQIRRTMAVTPDSRVLSWLPPYHDMGLIGGLLTPVYCASPVWVMSPLSFLFDPIDWLRAITEHRISHSGGPNFAYELCLRRLTEASLATLDLSAWRVAFSGAEVVRAATLRRFAKGLAPAGFRFAAFSPCYGLAEATLMVTAGTKGDGPMLVTVDTEQLAHDEVRDATDGVAGRELVSSGSPWETQVAIVHPRTGEPRGEREVGEIWVAGTNVARGYWNHADATEQTFAARLPGSDLPYLRTGDLGFVQDGELFVTGRGKELIIVSGRNIYPQDVEACAQAAHAALAPGGGAAFAVDGPDEEKLVLVQELRSGSEPSESELEQIFAAVRDALADGESVTPHVIVLVRKPSIPKTTSGKIRRLHCRELYLAGRLDEIGRSEMGSATTRVSDHASADLPAQAAGQLRPSAAALTEAIVAAVEAHLPARAPGFEIDLEAPFRHYGLGSKSLVGISGELSEQLGRPLAPTLLYDYPSVAALAAHLAGEESPSRAPAEPLGNDSEPLAIIGMACRFPGGAADPESFWALLERGGDAVAEVPAERWDADALCGEDAAATCSRHMAAIDDVLGFDAGFFAVSPREAESMDPQQRLLLEVSWEALEHAGIPPSRLNGGRVGVYVGMATGDYGLLPLPVDAYSGTGNARSAAAGRLSYQLGVHGPSMVIDTACSSSLVAMHLAGQSLAAGESDIALVAGVNAILSPETTMAMSKLEALSRQGRCKTFDASADGYVRGEGCGVVLLKRLSDAQRDGDRVLACVRGSAVNQDGRSNGLTAPCGPAQQEVVRAALRRAGVEPAAIDYVETHGTGTELGDPIELHALDGVLREGRPASRPLLVGSVKTNIGHLEAAAGIAGVIKTVLALQHERIPPHLHFQTPNPHIDWAGLRSEVVTELRPWPRSGSSTPRLGGVSSFGITGTNGHVVLEGSEGSAIDGAAVAAESPHYALLPISARSEAAVARVARRYQRHLEQYPELSPAELCVEAAVGREHLPQRVVLLVDERAQLLSDLEQLAAGQPTPRSSSGRAPLRRRPVAMLFTGQGSQYGGMGRGLYERESVFRAMLDRCQAGLAGVLERPLLEVMFGDGDDDTIHQTAYAQPALFALGYGLAEQWRSWGIVPDVVIGHSVGEITAACVAGVISLDEALRVVAARGQLMQAQPAGGAMAVVRADAATVEGLVAAHPGSLSVAAYNGPAHVVISGRAAAVGEVCVQMEHEGIRTRSLRVSHAFHSPLMDPLLAELESVVAGVTLRPPRLPMISNLSGERAGEELCEPSYWRRHAREPVRFAAGLTALQEAGAEILLELGPHPTLLSLAADDSTRYEAVPQLPSLRRGRDDALQMLESLAALYAAGQSIAWQHVVAMQARPAVPLPSYPFEHESYGPPELRSATRARRLPDAASVERYALAWEPLPIQVAHGAAATGSWLILDDAGGLGVALRQRLEEAGASCVSFDAAGTVDRADPDAVAAALEERVGSLADLVGVVSLWALDAELPDDADDVQLQATQRLVCGGTLSILQVLEKGRRGSPRMWLATRAAQAVRRDSALNLAQSSLAGLARSIILEQPEHRCVHVDLEGESTVADADALFAELLEDGSEGQIAYRAGTRYGARLVRASTPPEGSVKVHADATYLISGGLGALGLRTSEWLVDAGARHLVLLGRRGATEASQAALTALRAKGAEVTVAAVDVADRAAVAELLASLAERSPPLRGVIHAAGVLDDGLLSAQSWARAAAVMAAKVRGGWNLHRLTRDLSLDFFVLFGSAAGLLGSPGQGTYAAANTFLDGLAHYRRAVGLPAVTIDWGPWADLGMAARGRAAGGGIEAIEAARALTLLGQIVAAGDVQVGVLAVDWPTLLQRFAGGEPPPLLQAWAPPVPEQVATGSLRDELGRAAAAARPRLLLDHLTRSARHVLGLRDDVSVDPEQPLNALGLDSLMAVQLRNAVARATGLELDATLLFDQPSLGALSTYLLDRLALSEAQAEATPATATVSSAEHEPIAIVGMAVRFPGADSLAELWDLLASGGSAICEAPPERFDLEALYHPDPTVPGKISSRWGGWVRQVDGFDPKAFGISVSEAAHMDPQQRLLLEAVWQALADAGRRSEELAGTRTGVFVGISAVDYARLPEIQGQLQLINPFTGTGNALCIAANRISYLLGLRGPSLAVDTACSSSLMALHLACQSLRSGESERALVGGVNVILAPEVTIAFSKAMVLAPDGRCKTFDAGADGFVRGEGAGAVVLEPLSRALANNDRIYAIVRGSATGNDGRSNGLMAPNRAAQVEVIRRAHQDAGIESAHIEYVEAHGTGTKLGDPIEASALGEVVAPGRPADRPCLVGSVKTNIGHLESAAGIAGLIKVALSLHHGAIPPSINFSTPSPLIPFERLRLAVCSELTPWQDHDEPALAGISSFGFGGTNVHAVLERAPRPAAGAGEADASSPSMYLLPITAHSQAALRQAADSYASFVESSASTLHDICATAALRQSHRSHRLAVFGRSRAELVANLRRHLAGEEVLGVQQGTAPRDRTPRVAFVFPGQGSQWWAMGRDLAAREPELGAALAEYDALLRPHTDWSLLHELLEVDETTSRMHAIDVIQPALVALAVALARLYRSYGVVPAAVVGHSMGEVGAAHLAELLSPAAAAEVIAKRSRKLGEASGTGAMAVIGAGPAEIEEVLPAYRDSLVIAAHNSPSSTVVAGGQEAVDSALNLLGAAGVFCRRLKVDIASHSPAMTPLAEELTGQLQHLEMAPAQLPFYSSVLGDVLDSTKVDMTYWARGIEQPVCFAEAVAAAARDGIDIFLELSPHPSLGVAIEEVLHQQGVNGSAVTSLRRHEDEQTHFFSALAKLFTLGVPLAWETLYGRPAAVVSLPAIPWQRQRHWLADSVRRRKDAMVNGSMAGRQLRSPHLQHQWGWEVHLSTAALPYLADHQLFDAAVLPAAWLTELILAKARLRFGDAPLVVEDLTFLAPVFLEEEQPRVLQLYFEGEAAAGAAARVYVDADDAWTAVAEATVRFGQAPDGAAAVPPVVSSKNGGAAVSGLYESLRKRGLMYGPTFRVMRELYRNAWREHGVVAKLDLATGARAVDDGSLTHPTLVDGAFQALVGALGANDDEQLLYLPESFARVAFFDPPRGTTVWARALARKPPASAGSGDPRSELVVADLEILDTDGRLVIEINGFRLRRTGRPERPQVADLEPAVYASPATDRATLLADLKSFVSQQVLALLGDDEAVVDAQAHLSKLGFDSLMLLDLRSRLEKSLGVRLSPTVAWKYPTLEKLAVHLVDDLGFGGAGESLATPATASADAQLEVGGEP